MSFSNQLLVGNGGYYPLQVRTVLERGELAFQDMPFLFYLDAGIVKAISLFGVQITDEFIIIVVQVVDSLSVPLLLIPLYQLCITIRKNVSASHLILATYTILSFHTMVLLSTSQKNALAITFIFFSFSYLLKYYYAKNRKHLFIGFAFFLLVGLTHFGAFTFALLLSIFFVGIKYRAKALVPIVIIIGLGLSLIYAFDDARYSRLVLEWGEMFSLPHPPQLLISALFLGIAIFSIIKYRKTREYFTVLDLTILQTLIASIIIVSLPIFNPQLSGRLTGFLFIPVTILFIYFEATLSIRLKKGILALLTLISLASILLITLKAPKKELSDKHIADLKRMKMHLSSSESNVVVSKHNLEFWIAWYLRVDVSQESRFDKTLMDEYDNIYIINQLGSSHPQREVKEDRRRNHFDEPLVPSGSSLIYSSKFFKLYEYHR